MILHGIEYQRPTSLNMRILADHVTYSFLAFMKSIFHFCLGCYCGGYSQNGRSNLSSCIYTFYIHQLHTHNHCLYRAVRYLYNSVIFEGATLVYRPDCNAEDGCHPNSARATRGRYWLWQPPEALQEGWYTSVAPEQNHAIIIITTWSHDVSSF